ncbi:MAG: hypothetical protein ABH956_01060 [Candidatus Nealsonbacteria bacterium]
MENIISGLIGIVGVIIGWFLNFFTDLIKNKYKKHKLVRSLFIELQFNQDIISYKYLYSKNLFKNSDRSNSSIKEKKFLNLIIKLAVMKELGWGFKTSAYNKAELEGVLIDLPSYVEIVEIYRIISNLQKYGIPKDEAGWFVAEEKLEGLKRSFDLVIKNFYKNKKEWRAVIQ